MQTDIEAAVAAATLPPEGLTYYHELDPTLFSLTSETFAGAVYGLFGLTNIADTAEPGNPYPQLNAEYVAIANPDLIFLADTKCCERSSRDRRRPPGLGRHRGRAEWRHRGHRRRHRLPLGAAHRRLHQRRLGGHPGGSGQRMSGRLSGRHRQPHPARVVAHGSARAAGGCRRARCDGGARPARSAPPTGASSGRSACPVWRWRQSSARCSPWRAPATGCVSQPAGGPVPARRRRWRRAGRGLVFAYFRTTTVDWPESTHCHWRPSSVPSSPCWSPTRWAPRSVAAASPSCSRAWPWPPCALPCSRWCCCAMPT